MHRVLDPPLCPKVEKYAIHNHKKLDKLYLDDSTDAIPNEKDPFYSLK